MVIRADDKKHVKNYHCMTCNSPPGTWCVSANGKVMPGYSRQHRARFYFLDRYLKGQMVAGTLVPFACVEALEELDKRWPGATHPRARLAIIEAVLKAKGD